MERNKRMIAVTAGGLGDTILFSPVLDALKTISSYKSMSLMP